jgi:hypothetical protein
MVTSAAVQKIKIQAWPTNLSLRITVPRVNKLRFMWQPSFNLVPAANDWDARSLPARSTKFCTKKKKNMVVIVADYQLNYCFLWLFFSSSSLFLVKRRKKFMIHTTVAARELDLSLPRNSRAELSIVWQNTLFSERKCEKLSGGPTV